MSQNDFEQAFNAVTLDHIASSRIERKASAILVPVIGILSHPDRARIGEIAQLVFDPDGLSALSRLTPLFNRPGSKAAKPLLDPHLSRSPIQIKQINENRFAILPPARNLSAMVNGRPLNEITEVSLSDLGADIIISLPNSVILSIFQISLEQLRSPTPDDFGMIGISKAMHDVRMSIRRTAKTDIPILIRGETGTGKELVATAIHTQSNRSESAMVTVNMAAISPSLAVAELFGVKKGAFTGAEHDTPGLFEQANKGTLFLDEIGDTPEQLQPMLLRALEYGQIKRIGEPNPRTVDVRIVSATDHSLRASETGPSFNQPLLQRLRAATIQILPLKLRRIDIGLLLKTFFQNTAVDPGNWPSTEDMTQLALYNWPGNVRELRNQAMQISLGNNPDLPTPKISTAKRASHSKHTPYKHPSEINDETLLEALDEAGWIIKIAAETLNISRTSLYQLMETSPSIRNAETISPDEITKVVETIPGGLAHWAKHLRVGQKALNRRIKSLNAP